MVWRHNNTTFFFLVLYYEFLRIPQDAERYFQLKLFHMCVCVYNSKQCRAEMRKDHGQNTNGGSATVSWPSSSGSVRSVNPTISVINGPVLHSRAAHSGSK